MNNSETILFLCCSDSFPCFDHVVLFVDLLGFFNLSSGYAFISFNKLCWSVKLNSELVAVDKEAWTGLEEAVNIFQRTTCY